MKAKEAAIFWLKMPKEKRDIILDFFGVDRKFDGHTYVLKATEVKDLLEGYAMHLLIDFTEVYT